MYVIDALLNYESEYYRRNRLHVSSVSYDCPLRSFLEIVQKQNSVVKSKGIIKRDDGVSWQLTAVKYSDWSLIKGTIIHAGLELITNSYLNDPINVKMLPVEGIEVEKAFMWNWKEDRPVRDSDPDEHILSGKIDLLLYLSKSEKRVIIIDWKTKTGYDPIELYTSAYLNQVLLYTVLLEKHGYKVVDAYLAYLILGGENAKKRKRHKNVKAGQQNGNLYSLYLVPVNVECKEKELVWRNMRIVAEALLKKEKPLQHAYVSHKCEQCSFCESCPAYKEYKQKAK